VRRFYRKASVFHLVSGARVCYGGALVDNRVFRASGKHFLPHVDSHVIPIIHSPFSTGHNNRGVAFSPWRSYSIGSSFSSFSILHLHSPRRCDNPY
jgi:hypothetical protein